MGQLRGGFHLEKQVHSRTSRNQEVFGELGEDEREKD